MAGYKSIIPADFGTQAISATPTVDTVYTVPALTKAMLKSFDICNTTAIDKTVRVFFVPSAGSPSTGNAIIYDLNVSANQIFSWNGLKVMGAGATIQTSASAVGLTAHFSGGEAT